MKVEGDLEPVDFPRWTGLGCDDVAVARAKLEHLVGPPPSRGDAYKMTFEYDFVAEVDGETVGLRLHDWKAAEVRLGVGPHPDPAVRARVTEAFIELLTCSPLGVFRDRFRYDAEAGRAYHSDGTRAFADFAKS